MKTILFALFIVSMFLLTGYVSKNMKDAVN